MTKQEQIYYDRIQDLLLGRKVTKVFYEELDYQTGEEHWRLSEFCHSVDMNVILELDGNELIQIKWDNTFGCYGIGLESLNELNERVGIKTLRIDDNDSWSAVLNQKLVNLQVSWDAMVSSPLTSPSTIFLPQTWAFNFENGEILWISAFETREGLAHSFWADHLTVLFSLEELEKYNLVEASKQHVVKMR